MFRCPAPVRGCSSMVELQPSKLTTRVRFPSPAPSERDAQAHATEIPSPPSALVRRSERGRVWSAQRDNTRSLRSQVPGIAPFPHFLAHWLLRSRTPARHPLAALPGSGNRPSPRAPPPRGRWLPCTACCNHRRLEALATGPHWFTGTCAGNPRRRWGDPTGSPGRGRIRRRAPWPTAPPSPRLQQAPACRGNVRGTPRR